METTLAAKLNSYKNNYWDFTEYRENKALIKYPAMMVAPMQEQLLQNILQCDPTITNILDPFVGSGTSLGEGLKLGLDVYGIDINPLAILITRVRLEGVPNEYISEGISRLKENIELFLGNTIPVEFINIDKWFRKDVIADLSTIKRAIQQENNIQIRRFFWVCFADTVRRYSNTRSTTFKLHIKEQEKIKTMKNDCIQYFVSRVSSMYPEYINKNTKIRISLYTGDSINVLKNFDDNSIDLICTSPPYGDNHTTVTYGQFSILPLLWIDLEDMDEFDKTLLKKFNTIDKMSIGGKYKPDINDINIEYEDLIEGISEQKTKKVLSFISDYCKSFKEMARVLKSGKRMVLTLGNRRVDNKEFPFDVLNDRLAKKYGLKEEAMVTRNIQCKRMPTKVSNLPNLGSVNSMSKEYVKIYKKI